MAEVLRSPLVFSDIDGTAFKRLGLPWLSNPLVRGEPPNTNTSAYADFLQGMIQEGAEIGGLVSRRPDICRRMTDYAIRREDLERFFPEDRVHLMRSLAGKAGLILSLAQQQPERRTAMLENRPDGLGPAVLSLAMKQPTPRGGDVTIGVVDGPGQRKYMKRCHAYLGAMGGVTILNDKGPEIVCVPDNTDPGSPLRVTITPLGPYSLGAGAQFATSLRDAQTAHQLARD